MKITFLSKLLFGIGVFSCFQFFPGDVQAAPSITLSAVYPDTWTGRTVNLVWTVTGGGGCMLTDGSSSRAISSSPVQVNPTAASTTYTITCTDSVTGESASRSRTVTACPPVWDPPQDSVCSGEQWTGEAVGCAAALRWPQRLTRVDTGTKNCGPAVPAVVTGVCGSAPNTCASGTYNQVPSDTETEFRWTCYGDTRDRDARCDQDKPAFSITASAGAGGSISPSRRTVIWGNDTSFTITPNLDYSIHQVLVDGIDRGRVGTYTFSNVRSNHTIEAVFIPARQDGQCSNSRANTCVSGTFSDRDDTDLDYMWDCLGISGGRNATMCSYPKVVIIPGRCGTDMDTCQRGSYRSSPSDTEIEFRWSCTSIGVADTVCSAPKVGPGSIAGQCGSTYYTCEAGNPANGATQPGNSQWDCLGINGGQDSPRCFIGSVTPSPWAELTTSGCEIEPEASTCAAPVSWQAHFFEGSPRITAGGSTISNERQSPPGMTYPVTFGATTFSIYDDSTRLGLGQVNATCKDGNPWVDGKCVGGSASSCTPRECSNPSFAAGIAQTCTTRTFTAPDGCPGNGTVTCPGTRSCDYNWREVAP